MSEVRYRRSPEALHSEIGDDVVALHVQQGHCYGMDNVAADIWRMLDEPIGLDQICQRLKERYEVDDETCRAEVGRFIDSMHKEQLIELV